jgi:hypothetical protein
MSNRGFKVRNMILEGLPADSQFGMMQPGDSEAQSPEPGRQLGWVSFEELRDSPTAAAPSFSLGLGQRGIALNQDKNIGQGRLKGPDRSIGVSLGQNVCVF